MMRFFLPLLALMGFVITLVNAGCGLVEGMNQVVPGPLSATALVDQFYKDVQKLGGGRWDTSSLFKRLRVIDGLT